MYTNAVRIACGVYCVRRVCDIVVWATVCCCSIARRQIVHAIPMH